MAFDIIRCCLRFICCLRHRQLFSIETIRLVGCVCSSFVVDLCANCWPSATVTLFNGQISTTKIILVRKQATFSEFVSICHGFQSKFNKQIAYIIYEMFKWKRITIYMQSVYIYRIIWFFFFFVQRVNVSIVACFVSALGVLKLMYMLQASTPQWTVHRRVTRYVIESAINSLFAFAQIRGWGVHINRIFNIGCLALWLMLFHLHDGNFFVSGKHFEFSLLVDVIRTQIYFYQVFDYVLFIISK